MNASLLKYQKYLRSHRLPNKNLSSRQEILYKAVSQDLINTQNNLDSCCCPNLPHRILR